MNWQKTVKHELPGGQTINMHPVSVMGNDGRWHPHVTMSAEDWAAVQAALEGSGTVGDIMTREGDDHA